MAVKKAAKAKPAKLKTTAKSGLVTKAVSAGMSLIGGKKTSKGGKKRHKKSALFYAREIQRLKLKKRYEKVKLGISMR